MPGPGGRARSAGAGRREVVRPGSPADWLRTATLGLVPALIFVAHFFYGAALDLPALVLLSLLSALLVAALVRADLRRELSALTPVWAVLGPFVAVVAIAAWTLTPAVPGGPHPIWDWAGMPGASTLNRSATVLEIIKLLGLASVFVLGCLLGARADRGRNTFAVILGIGAVYGVISLVLFLGGGQIAHGDRRLAGGFYSANIAGTQFGVLVLMATAWAVRRWGQAGDRTLVERITDLAPVLALILLFLACLLLTASRAAISATGLAVILFLGWAALDNRRSRWPLMALGGVLVLGAVLLLVQGNTLFADRFGTLAEGDTTRAAVAAAHWQAFLDSPLLGYGLGSYAHVNNQIMTQANAGALSVSVIQHNAYLQWLEEAGVIGAVPMFALIAVILGTTAWRAYRRPRNRILVVGLLAGSLIVLLHAAVDVSLNTPSFVAFWTLMLGLGFAMSQASSRGR
ncbi:MAG: O-antigen ligase family protein [Caulobacteraceae bacterium]|nr:O-antigen ligase family protein [Caulobacteraceae bacterium]